MSTDWFNVGNWTGIVPDNTASTRIDTITPDPTLVGAPGAKAADVRIGVSATGALMLQNGGSLSNTLGIIGDNAGSIGTATVDGAGSSWANSVDLLVGSAGNGTLIIRNGGAVNNDYGYVGVDNGATGVATVDGAHSTWINTSDLLVGSSGNGTLAIRNGGAVSNEYGFVGYDSGATGVVTVAGAGSTWTNRSELYIGSAGNGSLNIQNGGTVTSGTGFAALNPGSTGAVTVSGAGSRWTTAGDLYFGSGGGATLAILNGGGVSIGGGSYLGVASGAVGSATIDGTGSHWISSGSLGVGSQGSGTVIILNGATVSNVFGSLALQAGSTGIVTVDGTGSTWTNSADLHVGYGGSGALTISNGGSVSASTMFIAYQPGSSGELNIGAAVGQAATAPGTLSAASVNLGSGNGEIVFNHSGTNYTFAPVITGSGAGTRTVRVEAGKTILSAASTYTGSTIVNGGTLSVNGSIASSAVTVNAGGTLGGNGMVGNTTINGGKLAPGNSIGVLTVNGSLSFTTAASYMLEISPASADRVNVTGAATLAGATVNASFAAGSYVAKRYTIVNASGGISGTFGAVVNSNLPSGFKSSLSYDTKNAYLDLALAFMPPAKTGLTINQTNVANALTNSFDSHGGIPLVYGGMTAPTLTQASGEIATAVRPTMVRAITQFTIAMTDVATAGRSRDQTTAMGAADETDLANAYASVPLRGTVGQPFGPSARSVARSAARSVPHAERFEARWRTWAAGFGGGQTTDGNAVVGSSAASSRMFGGAAGADHWLSPSTVAGFALAGGGTSFSVAAGGSGRSDIFQAGAYVNHTTGSAYVSAAAAYGWHDVTTDRTLTISGIDQMRAHFSASSFAGRLEGGSRFATPWFEAIGLTPYAAAQVTTTRLPAYAETVTAGGNTFALSYLAKTMAAPRTELGVRSDASFAVSDALLTLRGRAAWARDFTPYTAASASFQALPDAGFVVNGAAGARDAALTTVSAEMNWRKGVALATTFEGEFSAVTRSYTGKSVASYRW
ncbi:autotransporter outer membrane beta-barrel domain-containing protein [Bradyrhizobium sp. HKCCYLRH3095]|uniref:autotransporter outer membrane beta-barrel domain-containing protein n=1 Tax=Bradyrhizobium sp. HKCCYLRH3095 TaxID=3420765 RepID=UPI003EB782BC